MTFIAGKDASARSKVTLANASEFWLDIGMAAQTPPSPDEIAKWHRWFAVECNNRAWDLAAQPAWTETEREEMRNAAFAARYHWGVVGTELNAARADGLLGHVLALLGNGAEALRYAESNLGFVSSRESPDWEVAFAHAILANAAAAHGDRDGYESQTAIAEKLGADLGAEDRAVFQTIFGRVTM